MNVHAILQTQPVSNFIFSDDKLSVKSSYDITHMPAQQLMHNFNLAPIHNLDHASNLDEATLVLNKTHRSVCFVVNSHDSLIGMISKARLGSRHILTIAKQKNCQRAELTVSDVMIPNQDIQQITLNQVQQHNVLTILNTMEQKGLEFMLVIDDKSSQPIGYFDLLDLMKLSNRVINNFKPINKLSELIESRLYNCEG